MIDDVSPFVEEEDDQPLMPEWVMPVGFLMFFLLMLALTAIAVSGSDPAPDPPRGSFFDKLRDRQYRRPCPSLEAC